MKIKKPHLLLCACAAFSLPFLLLASLTFGYQDEPERRKVYVPKNKPTIQAAIDSAIPNTSIIVTQDLTESPGFVVEGKNNISIGCSDRNRTQITTSISIIRSDHIAISGFRALDGVRIERCDEARVSSVEVDGGVFINRSQRIQVRNCLFLTATSVGAVAQRSGITVERCEFRNITLCVVKGFGQQQS